MDGKNKILTIPNLLTISRILILPFVVYYILAGMSSNRDIIFLLLGVQGVTDFLDGIIARKFYQVTKFGKILDPLADKLTFDAIMLSLLKYDFPLFIVILLLSRDIVIIFSGYTIIKKNKIIPVSNIWGKIATFSLVVYLISFIGGIEPLKNIFYYILLFAISASGISYAIYLIKVKMKLKSIKNKNNERGK